MEHYIVSARKYRPSTFAGVVGQKALTSTLKNAIATGRLAHSYLFCGSRGVGKTSCARIFAKTINCSSRTADGEACGECDSCRAFSDGNSMNIIELDAASHNGIEDMKAIMEQVQVPPTHGRYRVFIIDEVHMLSNAAFNAFLKTLEEPPAHVIFILATTEKHKIIPTILSRCQIYDFSRITVADMVNHLQYVAAQEGIEAEPQALNVIARQADGAMRDALSIFDQVAASSRGHITYASTVANLNVLDSAYYLRLVDAFSKADIPAALLVFHEVLRKGFDAQFFLVGLGGFLRDLMLASSPSTVGLIDAPDDVRASMASQAAGLTPEFFYAAMGLCNDADLNYRQASNKQLFTEVTLIRIAQLLNPSSVKCGLGEGALKPVERPRAAQSPSPAPSPAHASATATTPVQTASPTTPSVTHEPQASYGPPSAPSPVTSPAPAVRPVKPSSPSGRPALRAGGLSIHGHGHTQDAPVEKAPRNRPFDASNVAAAWSGFINEHPAEHLLINTMRAAAPQQLSGGKFGVSVPTPVQGRMLEETMDRILSYMRDKLVNDSFDIVMQVEDSGPSPQFWNDRQVLAHITEKYPAFSDFINGLHLKLL